LASFQICFSQEFVEEENWIGTIEGGQPPFLIHSFKNYSKQDVINAKEKLRLIHKFDSKDDWEGSYSLLGELSDMKLFWNSESGFVNYYVYTCAIELRQLNYGKAVNNVNSVTFLTEKSEQPFWGMNDSGQIKLIKVKWGEKHFLVKEEMLETFSELAAGYYGAGKIEEVKVNGEIYPTQISIWNSFWVKSEDLSGKKVFGLPVLPKPYEKLTKKPIEAKIISIGKHEKDEPTEEPVMTYSRRYVNIGLGKKGGIKIGMDFYIPDIDERITIVEVTDKISVGVLERWIDSDTQNEMCFHKSETIPCKSLRIGMKVKTTPEEILEDN
jgi:hypothetical protein